MFGEPYWMGGHGYGAMWLIWILLLVGVIWVVVGLSRQPQPGTTERLNSKAKSALDILNERYARGEIEQDEYEQKKKDLSV